jgi:hypothetical protein
VVLEKRSEFSENLTEFLVKTHWYFDKNSVSFNVAGLGRTFGAPWSFAKRNSMPFLVIDVEFARYYVAQTPMRAAGATDFPLLTRLASAPAPA